MDGIRNRAMLAECIAACGWLTWGWLKERVRAAGLAREHHCVEVIIPRKKVAYNTNFNINKNVITEF